MFPELAGEVQTWKLQMMSAACDTDRFSVPAYMRFGYDYVAKTDDGIALGGFRDYYPDSEIASAWGGTAPLNNKIAGKLAALASMITETSLEVKTSWSSAVGYTTSGLPVVREMRPGVWVCGAYNGHGNLLSFICGKAIVDRILQNKSVVFDLFNNRG
jgi:glycine/D-amino acid oxidase-like deaminating enzyme